MFKKIHHIAIISANYEASKKFYTEILGLKILREVYRADRNSYKLDLGIGDAYIIELFSFPNPPKRLTNPESTGLRHIAFEVENLKEVLESLATHGVYAEPIRIDKCTQMKFTFIFDPDGLPIELYEQAILRKS